ncbi:hypothetical protein FJZ31_09560 [Candidatus Poribacteria bacterium]|nr:hypothetical protein [Candidatus Poribacteria bacterium]
MRIQNIIDTYGLKNIPISLRSMIDLWRPYLQRLDTQIKHREVIENLLNPQRQPHWYTLTGQPGARYLPTCRSRRPTYPALYRRMLDHR